MAKDSTLPVAAALSAADQVRVLQGGVSKRATFAQVATIATDGVSNITGEDTPPSFTAATAIITAASKNEFGAVDGGAGTSQLTSAAAWHPSTAGTYTAIYSLKLNSGTAPTGYFARTSATSNVVTFDAAKKLGYATLTGSIGTGATDKFIISGTAPFDWKFEFFALVPGDWRALLAKIAKKPQQQIALLAALQSADNSDQIAAILLNSNKVPGLETVALSQPKVDFWPFDGMNILTGKVRSGVNPLTTYQNEQRKMFITGEGHSAFLLGPSTNGSSESYYIQIDDVSEFEVGDVIELAIFCKTNKPGNSGALLELIAADANGATIVQASTAFVLSGKSNQRRKMLTSTGVSPNLVWPAGATMILVRPRLNAPAIGDYAEFESPQLTKASQGVGSPVRRRKEATDLGRCTINVKRSRIITMSPEGSDTNLGDSFNPVKTHARALALIQAQGLGGGKIECRYGSSGKYFEPTGLLSLRALPDLDIIYEEGCEVHAGMRLTGWVQNATYANVYETANTLGESDGKICQYAFLRVQDESANNKIPLSLRDPRMRGQSYYLPGYTLMQRAAAPVEADAIAEIAARPMGTGGLAVGAAKVYIVMPDHAAPGAREVYAPNLAFYGNNSLQNSLGITGFRAGTVTIENLNLFLAGIVGLGQGLVMHRPKIIGARWDGLLPRGRTFLYDPIIGYSGNDGGSPHDSNFIRTFRAWLFRNKDEAWSDHYELCSTIHENGLAEQSGGSNWNAAYRSNVMWKGCTSRLSTTPDGGFSIYGDNDDVTVALAENCLSINDYRGFVDKAFAGRMDVNFSKVIGCTAEAFWLDGSAPYMPGGVHRLCSDWIDNGAGGSEGVWASKIG